MKRKIAILLALVFALSSLTVLAAGHDQDLSLPVYEYSYDYVAEGDYVGVVPFDAFTERRFLSHQSWTQATVPSSQLVSVTRNGRVYQGTLNRVGAVMQDGHNWWGAEFFGTVRFTGITMRGYVADSFEIYGLAMSAWEESLQHYVEGYGYSLKLFID